MSGIKNMLEDPFGVLTSRNLSMSVSNAVKLTRVTTLGVVPGFAPMLASQHGEEMPGWMMKQGFAIIAASLSLSTSTENLEPVLSLAHNVYNQEALSPKELIRLMINQYSVNNRSEQNSQGGVMQSELKKLFEQQIELVTSLQSQARTIASSEVTLALSYATSALRDLVSAIKELEK